MLKTNDFVTVADLPEVQGRKLANGSYIEPVRPLLYCPECSTEWSATPGDYFNLPKSHVFTCQECGVPLVLVRKRVLYENW